ncbi:MAG: polysaccharide deacetylase [Bacillus sp. (in: Bacteria)]|nr:polysaccharide deacetylase [Bacillus sp. (in: firmicutes)]
MGNLKSGWAKGTLIVISVIGFCFAGIVVSNYFRANAAGNESQNYQKNESINRPIMNISAETLIRESNDLKLEKERIRKQRNNDVFLSNKQVQEINKQPENISIDSSEVYPPSKDTTSPQRPNQESTPALSEQKDTEPEDPSSQKTVYLTFDDGPAPFSGEIITLLEKYQFKATFFLIDGNIRRYPDAVKLMVQSGETVGLHSVSHNTKQFYGSANSIIAELTQNRNTLKEIVGVDSFIMRTPYGSAPHMTPEYRKAVIENGYLMWDWNIDSRDWHYKDGRYVNSIIEQITKIGTNNGPFVILLHERKETLAHLPALLDYLSQQGFECKTIDSSMTPYQFKFKNT